MASNPRLITYDNYLCTKFQYGRQSLHGCRPLTHYELNFNMVAIANAHNP